MTRFPSSPRTADQRTMSHAVRLSGRPGQTNRVRSLDAVNYINIMTVCVYWSWLVHTVRHHHHARDSSNNTCPLASSLNSNSESKVMTRTGNDLSAFFLRNGMVNIKAAFCRMVRANAQQHDATSNSNSAHKIQLLRTKPIVALDSLTRPLGEGEIPLNCCLKASNS